MPPRNDAQTRYFAHSELRGPRGDVQTQKDSAVNRNFRAAAAFSFAHIQSNSSTRSATSRPTARQAVKPGDSMPAA
jgi:hypothetical protein